MFNWRGKYYTPNQIFNMRDEINYRNKIIFFKKFLFQACATTSVLLRSRASGGEGESTCVLIWSYIHDK